MFAQSITKKNSISTVSMHVFPRENSVSYSVTAKYNNLVDVVRDTRDGFDLSCVPPTEEFGQDGAVATRTFRFHYPESEDPTQFRLVIAAQLANGGMIDSAGIQQRNRGEVFSYPTKSSEFHAVQFGEEISLSGCPSSFNAVGPTPSNNNENEKESTEVGKSTVPTGNNGNRPESTAGVNNNNNNNNNGAPPSSTIILTGEEPESSSLTIIVASSIAGFYLLLSCVGALLVFLCVVKKRPSKQNSSSQISMESPAHNPNSSSNGAYDYITPGKPGQDEFFFVI